MSYVYLIHLDQPLSPNSPSRNYIGYTRHLPSRMEAHFKGRGARFMQVARERNISWCVARIWPGDRVHERLLKRRKNAPKMCPICQRTPPAGQLTLDLEEDLL